LTILREELEVASEAFNIYVRKLRNDSAPEKKAPLLLIHGARVPGIGSFDLQGVEGGSLASDLAKEIGCSVYLMDIRGYGNSTRPEEMEELPGNNSPLVRSSEAARDIGAVVDEIIRREKFTSVSLFGWATGGQWAGYYAALHSNKVDCLITHNSLYGAYSEHPSLGHGSDMEDPEHTGQFNFKKYGAYSFNTKESLFTAWDRSIPIEDKTKWRDPKIAEAYSNAALASDPTSYSRTPQSFRAPLGCLEDSFYLATGRQLWDASLVFSKVLIVRSERDFWSRPQDAEMMAHHLVHSKEVRSVTLAGATHFAHLDRPERGRNKLIEEIRQFVSAD
jgi:pimeloyl-ACP methyl ester carboxylesterase